MCIHSNFEKIFLIPRDNHTFHMLEIFLDP